MKYIAKLFSATGQFGIFNTISNSFLPTEQYMYVKQSHAEKVAMVINADPTVFVDTIELD